MKRLIVILALVLAPMAGARPIQNDACFCPPGRFCIPELPPCVPQATCPPVGSGPCRITH